MSTAAQPSLSRQLEAYRMAMFAAHGQLVLGAYLDPWARRLPELAAVAVVRERLDPQVLAVIVDDRPTPGLRFTVLNTLLMGKLRWRLTPITAPATLEQMRALLAGLEDWVQLVALRVGEAERYDWLAYNTLLKTPGFWGLLRADRLLIVQTDTLLIEPPDPAALAYGYVGAPWAKGRILCRSFPRYGPGLERVAPQWEMVSLCDTVPAGLMNGNGGLSIRDPQLMQRICKAEAPASPPQEPEDIFFARHLARYDPRPAPAAVVERFACETHYQPCAGAHAAWRYLEAAQVAEIYERHLQQVMALTRATAALLPGP